MNLAERMEYQKIKQRWGYGENLTDTDIMMLMAWIENMTKELKHYKDEHSLVFGKSRTGGKIQNSSFYGKMGDKKSE